jgi:hypothetical protein
VDSGAVDNDEFLCSGRLEWVDKLNILPVLIFVHFNSAISLGRWAWLPKMSGVDLNSCFRKPARLKMIAGPLLNSMKGEVLIGGPDAVIAE